MMRSAEDTCAIHFHKHADAEACACNSSKILQREQLKIAAAMDVDSTIRALHEEASAERFRCIGMYAEVLAKMDRCQEASVVRHSELEALVLDIGSTASAALQKNASHPTLERLHLSSTGEAFKASMGSFRTKLEPSMAESSSSAAFQSTASHLSSERLHHSSTGEAFEASMGSLRTRLEPAMAESTSVCASPLPVLDFQLYFDQAAPPQPLSPLS